ncbi:MAG: hypothetical protein A4E66_01075 [Syntrophus sp. PtaB.Bin001]|nr:MAG: hypothetical protein A4E66_01075 [Syntrophus sp. PtaB.Bin001]
MPNKIDELFSPERIRRNWQKTEKRAEKPVFVEAADQSPLKIVEEVHTVVKRRFFGDEAEALHLLLEELQALLSAAFPTAERSSTPEDQEENLSAIHEVLNRLEDLVDAFEMADRRRQCK